ncbi:MAG: SAM-dependent methyltransferase [Thermoanaerobaculia bacterium]|nr:SAM-dependent methyltransferase [Thermoanaerobaculia bacterium]
MSRVAERLRALVRARGPIPFAVFMEEALYGEGGYYAGARSPVGRDFVTGSSLSPLFGRSTATLLSRLAERLDGRADYFEAGFGGGQHLRALLDAWPEDRRGRVLAWDRTATSVPAGVDRLGELGEIADRSLAGVVFSYELFDALPIHRLVRSGEEVRELRVGLEGEDFRFVEAEISEPSLAELLSGSALEQGQVADLSPLWRPLYASLASKLERGLVVTCDYGFSRPRLLDPRVRAHGTLACYREHRVHRDPFRHVGEQDLTAHVDFTALRETGEELGLETVAFSRQALWLTATGLFDALRGAGPKLRGEAMALLDGDGMGEEIRVLVQAKDVDPDAVLDLDILGRVGAGVP